MTILELRALSLIIVTLILVFLGLRSLSFKKALLTEEHEEAGRKVIDSISVEYERY